MGILNLICGGRMSRLPYAACTVAFLAMLTLAAKLFPTGAVSLVMPPIWMLMVAAPRLRDIGWSPWWALAVFGPNFIVGFVAGAAHLSTASEVRAAMNSAGALATLGVFVVFGFLKSAHGSAGPKSIGAR